MDSIRRKYWNADRLRDSKLYSCSEAAKLCGISQVTLHKWAKSGEIKKHNIDVLGRFKVNGLDIKEFVKKAHSGVGGTAHKRKHRERHRARDFARSTINTVLQNGRLKKRPCDICKTTEKVDAHHPNYGAPFKIRWLCEKHHYYVHKQKKLNQLYPDPGEKIPEVIIIDYEWKWEDLLGELFNDWDKEELK